MTFKEWFKQFFEKSLFGRYECKDNPDRGSWTKKELKDKYKKLKDV
jgi:hypothetical protein